MAKILKGKFEGKRIYMPSGEGVRPITSFLKKAIFDYLGDLIKEKEILELYAGSGTFGFEALSRGASKVVFVDDNIECIKTIKRTINALKLKNAKSICMDVFMALRWLRKEKYDLIFLDPPYKKQLLKSTLLNIIYYDILKPNSFIIAKHHKKQVIKKELEGLILIESRKYGEDCISIWRKN
jgi:16S rRNA (guanine(966)-N(2))-methyltransferase RsmD